MISDQEFKNGWRDRGETNDLHWTREDPRTQIQLAFRRHWMTFQRIISEESTQGKRCIELGCGRGTVSMYFADNGWDCTLVDISDEVLDRAKDAFTNVGLHGTFLNADATDTKLAEEQYDVCVSIGLLEHFPDLKGAISEQLRLLRPGGVLLAYVVPEHDSGAQKGWEWLNDILELYDARSRGAAKDSAKKPDLYRSDAGISEYLAMLEDMPLRGVQASGIYSLPMLSPSINFPFTLNPPEVELRLVQHFQTLLAEREAEIRQDPWLCDEDWGQAFLVWGRKI